MNYFADGYKHSNSHTVSEINNPAWNSLPCWWIEIKTSIPACIYYFGPFANYSEAHQYQYGYIEDLIEEKAAGIITEIKQVQPTLLTITEDER